VLVDALVHRMARRRRAYRGLGAGGVGAHVAGAVGLAPLGAAGPGRATGRWLDATTRGSRVAVALGPLPRTELKPRAPSGDAPTTPKRGATTTASDATPRGLALPSLRPVARNHPAPADPDPQPERSISPQPPAPSTNHCSVPAHSDAPLIVAPTSAERQPLTASPRPAAPDSSPASPNHPHRTAPLPCPPCAARPSAASGRPSGRRACRGRRRRGRRGSGR
jgi:hypothetical protein